MAVYPVLPTFRPHDRPGLFFLALHYLTQRINPLPAVVVEVSEQAVRINLYGVLLKVYAEQATWQKQCLLWQVFERGQSVFVHVQVDLDRFSIFASLRSTAEPAWAEVQGRYPLDTVVGDARHIKRTREGAIFDVPSPDLRLTGLVYYGELTDGNDSSFIEEQDLAAPRDLVVIGHDENRRRLLLSLRQTRPPLWDRLPFTEGQVIPVQVVANQKTTWLVRWSAGHVAVVDREELPRVDFFWARVERIEPEAQRLRLSYWRSDNEWTVGMVTDNELELWADDNTTVHIARTQSLRQAGAGDRLSLRLVQVTFRLDGPRVRCQPVSDLSLTVKEGDVVTGTATRKIKGGLLVDIGVDVGVVVFLPTSQVDIRLPNDIGDYIGRVVQCEVLKIDEARRNIVVSRRSLIEKRREKDRTQLLPELAIGQTRKGVVKNIVEFGAFVDLGGIDGLLHITDMSWERINHPSEMVRIDQEIEVMILQIDREKQKIALGLKQKQSNPWDNVVDKYPVGKVIRGQVVNVMSYGAFVKLEPGIEGLVHISKMFWTKRNPNELVQIGDEIDVVILGVDKENLEISLGMKQAQGDLWDKVALHYPVNSIVKGKVRNLVNYGAFVELEEGIDALLHVSDMSWTSMISHPSEMLEKGQEVQCKVLSIDQEHHRIALGLKQLNYDPWAHDIPAKYQAGQIITGKVMRITNFGVFVGLQDELEEGSLHISELANYEVENPEDVVKVGDEIEVKVLSVDAADRKIALSCKQLEGSGQRDGQAITLEEPAEQSRAAPSPHPETLANLPITRPPGKVDVESRLARSVAMPTAGTTLEDNSPTSLPIDEQAVVETTPQPPPYMTGFDPGRLISRPPDASRPAASLEEDELLVDGAAASYLESQVGDEELESDLDAWLHQRAVAGDLAIRLEQRGLAALASLVRTAEGEDDRESYWEPIPPWATLASLLAVQGEATSMSATNAAVLEVLLRGLAGNPSEGLVIEKLAELLPPEFVVAKVNRIDRCMRKICGPHPALRLGLVLLEARAYEHLGQIERAFTILNETIAQFYDESLAAERDRLVPRFREDLQSRPIFFDRFERVFTCPVRQGGFALVIPVRDRDTGEMLALKHFLLKALTPAEMELAMEMFGREAALLRRIRHDNVVVFRDFLAKGCVLLEWLPGRPLDPENDGLGDAAGWWNTRRVLEVGFGIASALEAASQALQGAFVHNDLAPRNIMIHPDNYPQPEWVKLIDFGLSVAPEFYSISTVMDELGVRLREVYRAPELAAGFFGSPRSDIYSLGVILFQLLTRRLPALAGEASPTQLLRESLASERVPQAVTALLSEMIASDPKQRPANWHEVAVRLWSSLHHG